METRLNQNKVIEEVLKYLSNTIKVNYEIIQQPDIVERNKPACDALAKLGGTKVAIEHTSIDSVRFQRRDDSRFLKLLGPLKNELKGRLPLPGHYCLVIDMNVIPTGVKWKDIRQLICEWCLKVADKLEIGRPSVAPRHFIRERPKGVPFDLTLYRWSARDGQFRVARFSPNDIEGQRVKVLRKAIGSRGLKVAEYRNDGFRTVLILESNDIALGNFYDIGKAFIDAIKVFELMTLPDEVYLVETEVAPYDIYCLKFNSTLFPDIVISEKSYSSPHEIYYPQTG